MKQKELSVVLRILTAMCALVVLFALWVVAKTFAARIASHEYTVVFHSFPYALMFPGAFIALWDGWCIFREIGRDNSFCMKNALRLRRISICALVDTGLVLLAAVLWLTEKQDFLDPLLIFLFFAVVGVAVSVACSALSHLTMKAAKLQDDNDLTI